jgi:peptide/nickel transport system substrate-binding protein
MIAAACGGGSKKANNAGPSTATSESTTSTTATGSTDSTVAGVTSTTAAGAAAAGGTSATTAKKATTATTAKKSTVAPSQGSKAVTNVQGGLTNVTSAPTTAQPGAQPGGTLTLYKGSDIPALGPESLPVTGSFDMPDGSALYDLLAYTDNGEVKPQAMESLTSTDALVWMLKLHPNMKFSDGTPWDANAVKFNWQRLQDPTLHAIRGPIANTIASMDAVDPVTLKVTLKAKNALFPGSVTLIPYIGSPTSEQQQGADKFSQNPVGGGPFILKSWTHDSQKVFVRNPTYWNAPLPYLDGLTLKSVIDEVQRMNTFCADTSTSAVFIGAVGNADQMSKTNCGQVIPYGTNGGLVLFYNITKPPMNNLHLRQAIAKAINFDDYSKVVDLGQIPPTHSAFRTDSPFYDPSVVQPAFDAAGAQSLFDQAAQELGVSTINIPMGAFSVTAYANSASYIQAAINKYNHVHIDLQTIGTSQHVTECTTRTYVGICHYGNPFVDPDPTWVSPFTCAATANPTGYCNAQFDKDVADNEATLDPKQRIADIKDAQKQFYTDQPALFVEYRFSWIGASNNLQGIHLIADGGMLLDQLWFKR